MKTNKIYKSLLIMGLLSLFSIQNIIAQDYKSQMRIKIRTLYNTKKGGYFIRLAVDFQEIRGSNKQEWLPQWAHLYR